jgi:hypothetical protein
MSVQPPSGDPPVDTGRKPDGTFALGNRGNPKGRPQGARSKSTLMLEALLSKNMTGIGDVLVREALAGAHWAVKIVIASQLPTAKDRAVQFDLPKLESASDVPAAIRSILDAISAGTLTPTEANAIIAGLEAFGRSSVFDGHEARLQALEAALAKEAE